MDKTGFKDKMGRFITQGLFIDFRYDETYAKYTLEDEDKEYRGNMYPSLKRLFLEMEDPTQYKFANAYLYNWDHWLLIKNNKELYKYIERWEQELEVRIRAKGVSEIIKLSGNGNFNAAKWVADGSWETKRGRPSKAEKESERKMRERAAAEANEESARVFDLVRKTH